MNENDFQESTQSILAALKTDKKNNVPQTARAPLQNKDTLLMYVITKKLLENKKTIQFLADWRQRNNKWFPAQFSVTFAGTKKWAQEQLLKKRQNPVFL